jgi:hypothetical protein
LEKNQDEVELNGAVVVVGEAVVNKGEGVN